MKGNSKVVYEAGLTYGVSLDDFIAELQAVKTNPNATYEVDITIETDLNQFSHPQLQVIEYKK